MVGWLDEVKIRKKIQLTISKIVYTHKTWSILSEDDAKYNIHFYVYEGYEEEGTYPIFLISKQRLDTLGDVEIAIRPLGVFEALEKYEIPKRELEYIARKLDLLKEYQQIMKKEELNYKEAFIRAVEEYMKGTGEFKPVFLEIIDPVQEANLEKIDYDELVRYFLKGDYEVDPRIEKTFAMLIPRFSFNKKNLTKIQQTSPHIIMVTNPKTGKTTISERIGIRYDSVRVSRLLGFADSKDIHRGDLDGKNEPVIADEIQEEEMTGIFSRLLTYLETGIAKVGKGKQTINTHGVSPLVFVSNPRLNASELITSQTLLEAFDTFLAKITDNYEAFGSRIGLVVFGNDFKTARKSDKINISEDDLDKVRDVTFHILSRIEGKMSKIILHKKVREFIEKPFSEEYQNEIKNLLKEINNDTDRVYRFWKGHLSAFRHVRGGAIRLGIVENLERIVKENITEELIDKIIESAEKYFDELCNMNIKALESMSNAKLSSDYIKFIIRQVIGHEKGKILVLLLTTYLNNQEIREDSDEIEIAANELSNLYDIIVSEEIKKKYSHLSRLLNRNNFPRSVQAHLEQIGIKTVRDEKGSVIGFRLSKVFFKVYDMYKKEIMNK